MDADCLSVVLNKEVIAVNQDPRVTRGALVYSWPDAYSPANTSNRPFSSKGVVEQYSHGPVNLSGAPDPIALLALAACNGSDANQRFTYTPDGSLVSLGNGLTSGSCITYGGYAEANVYLAACVGWVAPAIGGQIWTVNASGSAAALYVVGSSPMGLAVNMSAAAPACMPSPDATVQVGAA
jgi:hypothetical protein